MSAETREPRKPAHFPSTHWSVLLCRSQTSDDRQSALSELLVNYWYALYAYCRRRGSNDHDAQDLTQGFLMHLLEGGRGFDSVSPEKGRFRSYLITAFKNYIANQHRASRSVRRGGLEVVLSMHRVDFCSRYDCGPHDQEDAERVFERSWAESLMSRTYGRLAVDYQAAGKSLLFELLEAHLTHRDDAIPRAEIGARLELSPAAVNMSLYRMRRRYSEILREEVAATVDDPSEIDDEILALMRAISH